MEYLAWVVLIFVISAAAAPILLAVSDSRSMPGFLSLILTIVAAVLMFTAKGFGDTVLVAAAWIGALLCALGAYLDRAMQLYARNLAWRLLKLDEDGLKKPRPDE